MLVEGDLLPISVVILIARRACPIRVLSCISDVQTAFSIVSLGGLKEAPGKFLCCWEVWTESMKFVAWCCTCKHAGIGGPVHNQVKVCTYVAQCLIRDMVFLAVLQATKEAWAVALAELAAAALIGNPALASALEAEKRPAKKQQLEAVVNSAFKHAMVLPFIEAAAAGSAKKVSLLTSMW